MVKIASNTLLYIISGLYSSIFVRSIPLESNLTSSTNIAKELFSNNVKAVSAAPHFVIYSDKFVSGEAGPPPISQIQVCYLDFPR